MASKSKPTRRSSLRQSLNSVGKVLDAINGREGTRSAKKAAVPSPTAAPRSSISTTPDNKSATRRRISAEHSMRPRPTSGLPTYRPKQPPSPVAVRVGTRRRLNSSSSSEQTAPPAEKVGRPISPLPPRAALRANLTNSLKSATPSPSPSTPPKPTPSPARPNKIVKTSLPRPPSSASSTPSRSATRGSAKTPSDSPSPLARHSRRNMSHISERSSEHSDEENVGLLLAPVASLAAPTPAMPRLQPSRKRLSAQTPTKPAGLPSRANLSYISPLPPSSGKKDSLRVPQRPPNQRDMRGSILSWEQLASDSSQNIDQDEFGRMLADIKAPFGSAAASPSLSSHLEIPESPCLSAIDSPGGFGSISQVLLPEVTPSPAVHRGLQQARFTSSVDSSAVESSTVTLLRLQLAAMENTAKERLHQIQAMEEELHNLKQSHAHQIQEVQEQLLYNETQSREKDEQAAYAASLEDQLRRQRVSHDQAIQDAVRRADAASAARMASVKVEQAFKDESTQGCLAASTWAFASDALTAELDVIRADQAMLAYVKAQAEQLLVAASELFV